MRLSDAIEQFIKTMLTQEAQGNHLSVDVLLVHAQDHLMTAMLAQELIGELIELYRSK